MEQEKGVRGLEGGGRNCSLITGLGSVSGGQ